MGDCVGVLILGLGCCLVIFLGLGLGRFGFLWWFVVR